jgi:hypothetical protein
MKGLLFRNPRSAIRIFCLGRFPTSSMMERANRLVLVSRPFFIQRLGFEFRIGAKLRLAVPQSAIRDPHFPPAHALHA